MGTMKGLRSSADVDASGIAVPFIGRSSYASGYSGKTSGLGDKLRVPPGRLVALWALFDLLGASEFWFQPRAANS